MIQFPSIPSRRAVVFGLVAISLPVFPAIAGVHLCRGMSSLSRLESRRLACTLVDASTGSRHSAARVGRHYLRMVPKEQNINALLALIQQGLPDTGRLTPDRNAEEICGAIAQSIEHDFACGRICQVKGWILSRTEARITGLAAML